MSECVKYLPVAVDEDDDWDGVVECKVEQGVCLSFTDYNTTLQHGL